MSDISKINPNGTEYNLKDATARNAIQSSKTLKSSVVTVTDAAPINAEDITVDITPIQDLHGYDRPWPGGCWKNKLPITLENLKARNTGGTWSGNVYTRYNATLTVNVDNGGNVRSLTINGTPNQDFNFVYDINTPLLEESLSYILSGCPTGGSTSTYFQEYSNFTDRGYADTGEGVSFQEFAHTYQYRVVQVTIRSGYNAQNLTFYPMIRLASEQDATFAPYSNICPIEGRAGAELDRVGKNHFNKSTVVDGKGINADGDIVDSSASSVSDFIRVTPNTDYYLTTYNDGGTRRVGFYDANKNAIGSSSAKAGSRGFTTPSNCSYCRVSTNRYAYDDTQLELGSTATSYEPYQGNTYTVSFSSAGTVYSGTLNVTTGILVVDKAMVVINDLTLSRSPSRVGYRIASSNLSQVIKPVSSAEEVADISCEIYTQASTVDIYYGVIGIGVNTPEKEIWMTCPSTIATVEDFKTAYGSYKICYKLATPQTYTLTPKQIKMLKGINTVYADCGDTQLKYQPDNVVGELKGEIEDNIIYEDYKWTTESSRTYSAGTPGTYGCSSWRDVKKEGYDVIGVTFVENRRFGDCILTLYYIPSTSRVEVIIFRATSSAVTIADEDIEYRVAYKKRT